MDKHTPPFDVKILEGKAVKTQNKAATAQLDQVFSSGFKEVQCALEFTHLFESLTAYTEEEIKAYILKNIENGPAFASDHQIIYVKAVYVGENKEVPIL